MKNYTHMDALYKCFIEYGENIRIEGRQQLLHAGETAHRLYFIESGSARIYLIDVEGREISTQFFFEKDVFGSLESLLTGRPSTQHLATMEACHLRVLDVAKLMICAKENIDLQAEIQDLTQRRLINYVNLYVSAIADSPAERYINLKITHKQKMERIPLNILAAYLGISAVHLSRIRRKIKTIGTGD